MLYYFIYKRIDKGEFIKKKSKKDYYLFFEVSVFELRDYKKYIYKLNEGKDFKSIRKCLIL